MAEQQFFTAAVFAFLGWLTASILAAIRFSRLTHGGPKVACAIVPVTGLVLVSYLVSDALYGPSSGYRSIGMGLHSVVLWILAVLLPALQFAVGFLAQKFDESGS